MFTLLKDGRRALSRWLRGDRGFGGIEIVVLLGLLGGAAAVGAWFGFGERELDKLLEVRPAGETAMGPRPTLIAEALAEKTRTVPEVVRVVKYLTLELPQGNRGSSLQLLASDLPGQTFRTLGDLKITEGRVLTTEDSSKPVVVVGKRYAEQQAPLGASGLPLGSTIEVAVEAPDPAKTVEAARLQVVGVFATGVDTVDEWVLMPLEAAQRLFRLEGEISGFFVTVKKAKNREAIADALRAALGDSVDVVVPQTWEKQLAGQRG